MSDQVLNRTKTLAESVETADLSALEKLTDATEVDFATVANNQAKHAEEASARNNSEDRTQSAVVKGTGDGRNKPTLSDIRAGGSESSGIVHSGGDEAGTDGNVSTSEANIPMPEPNNESDENCCDSKKKVSATDAFGLGSSVQGMTIIEATAFTGTLGNDLSDEKEEEVSCNVSASEPSVDCSESDSDGAKLSANGPESARGGNVDEHGDKSKSDLVAKISTVRRTESDRGIDNNADSNATKSKENGYGPDVGGAGIGKCDIKLKMKDTAVAITESGDSTPSNSKRLARMHESTQNARGSGKDNQRRTDKAPTAPNYWVDGREPQAQSGCAGVGSREMALPWGRMPVSGASLPPAVTGLYSSSQRGRGRGQITGRNLGGAGFKAAPVLPTSPPPHMPPRIPPSCIDLNALRLYFAAFPGFHNVASDVAMHMVSAAIGAVALSERSFDLAKALGQLSSLGASAATTAAYAEKANIDWLLQIVVAATSARIHGEITYGGVPPPVHGGRKRASAVAQKRAVCSRPTFPPKKRSEHKDPSVEDNPDSPSYHAVRVGRFVRSCIFLRWSDAEQHILDFDDAEFKSVDDMDEAVMFALLGQREGGSKREGKDCDTTEDMLAEQDVNAEKDGSEVQRCKKKEKRNPRKRGRPRKTSLTSPSTQPKRKRGRPRKRALSDLKSNYDEGEDIDEDFSQHEEGVGGDDQEEANKPSRRTRAKAKSGGKKKMCKPEVVSGYNSNSEDEISPQWTEMYDRLRTIHEITGSLVIDREDEDNADVRRWLNRQQARIRRWRRENKKARETGIHPIACEKVRLLEKLRETAKERPRPSEAWLAMLGRLKVYEEENGSFDIPGEDVENADLRNWLMHLVSDIRCKRLPDGTFINRTSGNPSPITAEKARLLEELGYQVPPSTITPTQMFSDMLERLSLHKEETGSFDIDEADADNADLRQWLVKLTSDIRKCRTSDGQFISLRTGKPSVFWKKRAHQLEALGYELPEGEIVDPENIGKGKRGPKTPTASSKEWREMYDKFCAYKEETGSVHIKITDMEHAPMKSWWDRETKKIRKALKRATSDSGEEGGPVTLRPDLEEKARLLEMLDENVRSVPTKTSDRRRQNLEIVARFDDMLERFVGYKAENGGSEPPLSSNDPQMEELCSWVRWLKVELDKVRDGKESYLSAKNLQQLSNVGFSLTKKKFYSWEERLEQMRQFKAEHGHLNIPVQHPLLGPFVKRKRNEYQIYIRNGTGPRRNMEKEVKILEDMGYDFSAKIKWTPPATPPQTWEGRFEELLEYKAIHGHCAVPKYVPGLGNWVKKQRMAYANIKKGTPSNMLTPERVIKLSEIGFVWNASARAGRADWPLCAQNEDD